MVLSRSVERDCVGDSVGAVFHRNLAEIDHQDSRLKASAGAFSVTTSQLAPVSCTAYDGSMGGANYFITQYEVTDISDIKNPPIGESIFVTLNTSSIVDFKCYDVDEKIVDASSDIEISEDWSTGKQNLNVWLGNGSSLTKTVFLIITGEDGSKHMLVINI